MVHALHRGLQMTAAPHADSASRRQILRSVLKLGVGLGLGATVLGAAAGPVQAGTGLLAVGRNSALHMSTGVASPFDRPLVLAHRGASALRPEHTLAAYARAIADGADYIEPDLVMTRDGVMVARHENNIADTTDVADRPEFASRRAEKVIDGQKQVGWFTEDFTFAELKTLRARERLGSLRPESQLHDGQFQIVSFDEIADFVAAESTARGRTIGLIPEIKHPSYFAKLGLPMEDRLLAAIRASRFLMRTPIIIQSFETANLKDLRSRISDLPQVQLMQLIGAPDEQPADLAAAGSRQTYASLLTAEGLASMATYADWAAPNYRMLIPTGGDERLGTPTGLVEAIHKAGMRVGTWTFRPENRFIAADFRTGANGDARNEDGSIAEIRQYLRAGVDAFFTDDTALGRRAVDGMSR